MGNPAVHKEKTYLITKKYEEKPIQEAKTYSDSQALPIRANFAKQI